jgi:WD40 repeat protein
LLPLLSISLRDRRRLAIDPGKMLNERNELAVKMPAIRSDHEAVDTEAHGDLIATADVSLLSQFPQTPAHFRPLCAAVDDFKSGKVDNNFLKDIKWSPDGLCLLASSDDNAIRLFEPGVAASGSEQLEESWRLPFHDRLKSVLRVQEGETIYDFAWLPTMISSDPASCCFFSTSRDNPVHVWDAFTGRCRGSYCAYTDAEELTAGYCIAFNHCSGSEQMYIGFNNCVRVFDLSRPGREHRLLPTFKRANRETTGQRGIISCIAFNPDKSGLYACGSYSRNVGLYAAPKGNLLYNLQAQRGGITQILWSRDGNYLFAGGRKDREILCWDVRNTGDVLLSLPRIVSTNQRLQVMLLLLQGRDIEMDPNACIEC